MKNSQELATTIKELAKMRKVTVGKMLSDCELSVNTLSSMQSGGYFPRLEAINKIADYLNCSVDYLLGRTDSPETTSKISTPSDTLKSDFIKIFDDLSTEDKIKVLYEALQLKNKNNED